LIEEVLIVCFDDPKNTNDHWQHLALGPRFENLSTILLSDLDLGSDRLKRIFSSIALPKQYRYKSPVSLPFRARFLVQLIIKHKIDLITEGYDLDLKSYKYHIGRALSVCIAAQSTEQSGDLLV
jgi:hypothetical protein